MVVVLSRQTNDQLTPLCDREVGLYDRLVQEISRVTSPEHAALFARPEHSHDAVRWSAEGQEFTPWNKLNSTQQEKLLQATQSILLDIRSEIQDHPNMMIAQHFDQYRQIPSLDYLYAVDGKPVLTGWGYSGEKGSYDPLASVLSSVQPNQKNRWLVFPWVTALTALSAGILTSLLWNMYYHSDKVCYATYPLAKDVEDALKEQDNNQALNKKNDQLLKSLELLKKQCKIPPVQPLEPQEVPELNPLPEDPKVPDLPPVSETEPLPDQNTPKKQDIPQPKPEKKADLPKDAWDKKDKSMLNGCWHLTTHLELYEQRLFRMSHQPVTNWTLCFNSSGGAGRQVLTRKDGGTCTGPLNVQFQGNQLVLNQPTDCQGAFHLIPGRNVCTRINDKEANCTYIDAEGHRSTGTFKR
ncbi:unnamed protein product [Commensalibacter communis]|uniref:hypothetical protein n=1 Tax=Commensalibacter communis TaxID=2972786 RepID=UPI0022FF7ABF|nr:hypothetical protein [Commensalibacter communis]CAI3922200.1 unnamed protein product [Commensalibacter communis]CAI3937648.1 unnamed protein product [Commensalibacter communis]